MGACGLAACGVGPGRLGIGGARPDLLEDGRPPGSGRSRPAILTVPVTLRGGPGQPASAGRARGPRSAGGGRGGLRDPGGLGALGCHARVDRHPITGAARRARCPNRARSIRDNRARRVGDKACGVPDRHGRCCSAGPRRGAGAKAGGCPPACRLPSARCRPGSRWCHAVGRPEQRQPCPGRCRRRADRGAQAGADRCGRERFCGYRRRLDGTGFERWRHYGRAGGTQHGRCRSTGLAAWLGPGAVTTDPGLAHRTRSVLVGRRAGRGQWHRGQTAGPDRAKGQSLRWCLRSRGPRHRALPAHLPVQVPLSLPGWMTAQVSKAVMVSRTGTDSAVVTKIESRARVVERL